MKKSNTTILFSRNKYILMKLEFSANKKFYEYWLSLFDSVVKLLTIPQKLLICSENALIVD